MVRDETEAMMAEYGPLLIQHLLTALKQGWMVEIQPAFGIKSWDPDEEPPRAFVNLRGAGFEGKSRMAEGSFLTYEIGKELGYLVNEAKEEIQERSTPPANFPMRSRLMKIKAFFDSPSLSTRSLSADQQTVEPDSLVDTDAYFLGFS